MARVFTPEERQHLDEALADQEVSADDRRAFMRAVSEGWRATRASLPRLTQDQRRLLWVGFLNGFGAGARLDTLRHVPHVDTKVTTIADYLALPAR